LVTAGKILIAKELVKNPEDLEKLPGVHADFIKMLATEDFLKVKEYEKFLEGAVASAISADKLDFTQAINMANIASDEIGISSFVATDAYVGAAIRYDLVNSEFNNVNAAEMLEWKGYIAADSAVTSVFDNTDWAGVGADAAFTASDVSGAYNSLAAPVSSLHSVLNKGL